MGADVVVRAWCVALKRDFLVPIKGLDPEIVKDLVHGTCHYLSDEAQNQGWAWMFNLEPDELLEYRVVKEFGDDVLMRHNRWFRNPRDPSDMSMTDGWRDKK
jgi:hypothetical protein